MDGVMDARPGVENSGGMSVIETEEQWAHMQDIAAKVSGPSLRHAVETIEVLREVARVARARGHDGKLKSCSLCDVIKLLPDWILAN